MNSRQFAHDKGDEPVPGYRLTEYLGGGTHGEVWKALELASGKLFALKIIDLSYNSNALKDLRPLKLAMNLNHPHLVPITKVWLKDKQGKSYDLHSVDLVKQRGKLKLLLILMSLGMKSLNARLKEVNRVVSRAAADEDEVLPVGIPPEELANSMRGAAKGIDYLNAARHEGVEAASDGPIVHCDITLENMLIVAGNEVQITYCDISAAVSPDTRSTRSTTSVVFSPVYSPPELLNNRPVVGTDQYSLAISYYELRTGLRPFGDAMNQFEMMTAHALGTLDFSSPILTAGERQVLQWATCPRVAERYPSCFDMVKQLERGMEGLAPRAPSELHKSVPVIQVPPAPEPASVPRIAMPKSDHLDMTITHHVDLFSPPPQAATPGSEPYLSDVPADSRPDSMTSTPKAPSAHYSSSSILEDPNDPDGRELPAPELDDELRKIIAGSQIVAALPRRSGPDELRTGGLVETQIMTDTDAPQIVDLVATSIPAETDSRSVRRPAPRRQYDGTVVPGRQEYESPAEPRKPKRSARVKDSHPQYSARPPKSGPGWLASLGGAIAAGLGAAADALRGRPQAAPDIAPAVGSRRHTDVSFPARVPVGKVHLLRVAVVPAEETLPSGEVQARPKPHAHDVTMLLDTATRLTVSVTAENFAIDGAAWAELAVPAGGPSMAVTFGLRGLAVGPGRVMIDFAQNGRPVGSVDLLPEVAAAGESPANVSAPVSDRADFSAVASPAPDVVLKVFVHRLAGGPGRLQFVVSSADPRLADLAVLDGDFGTRDLHADLGEWVAGHLRTLSELAAGGAAEEVPAVLAGIGASLYDQLLPPALKDLCWVLRGRGVRSVLVLSDDPHVPWELLKPFRTDPATGELQEDDFWGATYALTHWLRGRPPVASLSLKRVVAMAAGGSTAAAQDTGAVTRDLVAVGQLDSRLPASTHLPSAAAELGLMRSLGSASVGVECAPALRRRLHAVFEAGEFTALHVASHGTFAAGASDASAVHLEDGAFRAAEVSPQMAVRLRQRGPLVFFNACHSGRLGFGLTQLGSWGARLTQSGCGAFVGSLWSVTDDAALAFARHFYRLLGDGQTIGEAVRQARLAVRAEYPGDPTWLAYRCFADPAARLAPVGPAS